MPLSALLMVLGSGAIHALWNVLLKRSHNGLAFSIGFIGAQCLILAPVFAVALGDADLGGARWGWAALSAPLHFGYFLALLRGYATSDFSVVYPVARGLAPLLAALWGMLVAGEHPTVTGWVGMAAVAAGVAGLSVGPGAAGLRPRGAGLGWAALAAALIATYTVVDGLGARAVGAVVHFYLETSATLALLVLAALAGGRGADLVRELRQHGLWYLPLGLLGGVSYILVLLAMQQAPMGYVAAARESSILFGMGLSRWVLGEPVGSRRGVPGLLIVAGLVLLRLS